MKAKKILVTAVAGALAIALTACGGNPRTTSQGSAEPGSTAAPVAGWDINEQPRENLAQGGTLRLMITEMFTNWNPNHVDGNQKENSDLQRPLAPAYFNYNSAGEAVINNNYLVDFTEENNPNTVVTLNLNDKAVWGDGKPINAADWIATWKAMNGTNKEFKVASTQGFDQMESVEQGTSEFQVIIKFKSTYPDWKQQVGGPNIPMHADAAKDPATFNNAWTTLKNDWLAGPYKVESVTKDMVTEVPNERWWGEKPMLDKITWKAVAADAQASAFANKEVDWFDIGPDPDAFQRAKGTPDTVIHKAGGPNFRHFTFNTKAPNLTDVKVRQAIAMGLNREAIAKSDLAGIDWEAKPLNNNVYIESQTGYKDQAAATGITYDVAKANALLDEAGWTMNETTKIREKDGKPLVVKYAALTGVKASENEGLNAQNQLKEIGVDLQIVATPVADFASGKLLSGHNFDIVAFSWIGTTYPLTSIRQLYGTGQDSNYAQLSNPELDKLVDQIDKEMDPAKRAEMGDQAAKMIWESVHTLPLYQRPDLVATGAKVANYGAFGLGSPVWENVGFTK